MIVLDIDKRADLESTKKVQGAGETVYTNYGACQKHPDITFEELQPRMFSFNSPHGACENCSGIGERMEVDPELLIPNTALNIMDGAISVYSKMDIKWRAQQITVVGKKYKFDVWTPINKFTKKQFFSLKKNIQIENIIKSKEYNIAINKAFENKIKQNIKFTPVNLKDSYFDLDLIFLEKDFKEISIFVNDQSLIKGYEKMRTGFIANVSHELRTPLSSILASVETIKNTAKNDKKAQKKFLDGMENQAWRMTRLVEDLLTLSKIESDDKELHFEKIKIDSIIQNVIDSLSSKAKLKKIKFLIIKKSKKLIINADQDSIIQVFINLIDNAINYSKEKTQIKISFDKSIKQDKSFLKISVIDVGEGIEKKHLNRITQRFYRVDKDRSRKQGGTGLGLAIVKHIVQRHQGELTIKSETGVGSVFSVFLPIENIN